MLAETTYDTFGELDGYLKKILDNTIACEDAVVKGNRYRKVQDEDASGTPDYDSEVCTMPLYILEEGQKVVPLASGVNWGMAKLSGSHVNINDAYIKIGDDLIRHYPELFPKKQEMPTDEKNAVRKGHRHNDNIEIIWDDGTTMTGLLEGSSPKTINGEKANYPKQISTSPKKAELGKYLRRRLGVKEGQAIKYADLEVYGRTSIDVSLQGEGIYYFDFSTEQKQIWEG